jgi:DNA primase
MAFPPGFLDELRGRISLPNLVARRVKLERRGREFAGLCPFHNEKTASFYVVEDKNFFHCFGCGAHGDAIGFAMRADNLDFLEAVEKLAAEAGLVVPQSTPEEREKARRQKTLLETLEAAAVFYETQLWSALGSEARAYLKRRGLDQATIQRFRLGWAPAPREGGERHSLRRALAAEYGEPLLVEAGLLSRRETGEPFDYFRNRIMFPIGDRAGRVIAFGGRVLGDGQPKYLNSPESPLFAKGRVLYGWSVARAASAEGRDAIVTEGYMDVIALHRTGFSSAVAPLGTALTEFQLHELWRLGREPILCFDGDAAGRRAASRALQRALPLLRPGYSLRFAVLPTGEDPDSLIRSSGGSAFEQVLAAARPLADMLWEDEVRGSPRDTPERLAKIRVQLLEHVQKISDRTVRFEFETLFKERCRPWHGRRRSARTPLSAAVSDGPPPPPRPPARKQREILFCLLLSYPLLVDDVAEEFMALDIPEPELDKLRREILEIEASRPGLEASELRQHLSSNGFAATVDALLLPSVDSGFLIRRATIQDAQNAWAHVMEMLMGGRRTALAEASNHLIEDVSSASDADAAASWEQLLAARERALQQSGSDGDPI